MSAKFHTPLLRAVAVAAAAVCALSAFSAQAQGAPSSAAAANTATAPVPALRATIITATRTEQPLSDVVADVSVIERAEIERMGAAAVVDVLARLPGVEFARSGGPAGTSNLYIRGSEGRYAAVFIDGVRIDSQATGGAPWEAIPLALVDRIEVLRGPAAAVYGSDALAGVVQIFTRKGEGPFSPVVGLGVGRYGTRKLDAGFSGQQGAIDYSVALAAERSNGYNARTAATQNPDRDGYTKHAGMVRLGAQLDTRHRLDATALSNRVQAQYDSSTRWVDERSTHHLDALGLNWAAQWRPDLATRLSVTDSRVRYETAPSPYLATTHLRGIALGTDARVGAARLSATLERKQDRLDSAPLAQGRHQNAVGLGYGLVHAAHTLQLNVRHDNDSDFGGKSTGSAAYAYAISPTLRATASVGNAFRAPTVYQRYSIYGVSSLRPESARNAEIGLRYQQGATQMGVVAYRNRVTDLITFVSAPGPCVAGSGTFPGCYANTAAARMTGLTFSGQHTLGAYRLQGSLDLQDPRDLTLDKQLARRARHHAQLGVDRTLAGWRVGAEAQFVGRRFSGVGETQPMGGYALFNLSATSRVAREWTVLARLDNLADRRYETVSGYATAGRSLYLGLKWMPL